MANDPHNLAAPLGLMKGRDMVKSKYVQLVAEIGATLDGSGFVRSGNVFRAISGLATTIVEVQKSHKSSTQHILFTLNLGIVCGPLVDPERTRLELCSTDDAQLRVRVGSLLTPPNDLWWEVTETTDPMVLAKEVLTVLTSRALPYLRECRDPESLVKLWESGKSPGLTSVQRSRYLMELKSALAQGNS